MMSKNKIRFAKRILAIFIAITVQCGLFTIEANAAVISGKVSDLRTCERGRDDGRYKYAEDHTTVIADSNAVPVPNMAVYEKENPTNFTLTDADGLYSIVMEHGQTVVIANTSLTSGTFYTMERPLIDNFGDSLEMNRQAMLVDYDTVEDEDKLVIIQQYSPAFLNPTTVYIYRSTNFPITFNFRDSPLDPGQAAHDLVIEGILRWNEDLGFNVAEYTTGVPDCEIVWIESGWNRWTFTDNDPKGNPMKTEVWLQYDLLTSFDEVAQGEFGRHLGVKGEYYTHESYLMDTPFENESRVSDFEKVFINEMLRFYHNDFPSGVGAIKFYSEPSTFTYHINEPPIADGFTITPPSGFRKTHFKAEFINPIDPEDVSLDLGYQWQKKVSDTWMNLDGETSNTITGIPKGTTIRNYGVLSDDLSSVDFFTSSALVRNTSPTISYAVINPTDPFTDTLLKASSGTSFRDDDGDFPIYSYQWKRNGVGLPGESSETFNPKSVPCTAGDRISCIITVSDGEDIGTALETNEVVLKGRPRKENLLILY